MSIKQDEDALALLHEDMARSGIPTSYAKKLGFEVMDGREAGTYLDQKLNRSVVAYKIPFFDHKGKPINFARLRLLEGVWYGSAFSDNGDAKKGKKPKVYKYNQRANTVPHLYFPNVQKWPIHRRSKKIKLDYLCITEGEKKSIKACLTGIPCVALAGVFNYKSGKRSVSLIDEFSLFDFTETSVEICYDSDLSSNEQVRLAMNGLAAELALLKPKSLSFVILDGESTSSGKIGLDDFLCQYENDEEARAEFFKLPRKVDKRMDAIARFDKEVCFVKKESLFFNTLRNKFYKGRQQLFDEFDPEEKIPDPTDPKKTISPIKLWFDIRDKSQTDVEEVTYAPGKPERFVVRAGESASINTWRPSHVVPVKGEPTAWLELFNHITKNISDEHAKWFMQWLAYPLQNPGTKLFTAVFIHSAMQGVGKNFLVEPFLRDIYGKNWSLVNGSALNSPYNAWAAEKQFVFLDEIYMSSRGERKSVMGDLNALITNPTFPLNEKYQPAREVPNYVALYLTSNHSDALMLSPTDRRFLVIHAPEERLSRKFYNELNKLGKTADYAGKILNHLLSVDCSEFNPNEAAPITKHKKDVFQFSSDNMQYLVNTVINDPSVMFNVDGHLPEKQLWTADELATVMNKYAQHVGMSSFTCTPQSIASYLSHRLPASARKSVIARVGPDKAVTRFGMYAVFNREGWAERDVNEWFKHFKLHDPRFRQELLGRQEDSNVVDINTARAAK